MSDVLALVAFFVFVAFATLCRKLLHPARQIGVKGLLGSLVGAFLVFTFVGTIATIWNLPGGDFMLAPVRLIFQGIARVQQFFAA